MRIIAERAGIATYAVDYQLAPEPKYPVQIEEIEYFVRWLFDHATEQGVDPAKIAVGGDSAGGNMTCVIALKLRDERGLRPASADRQAHHDEQQASSDAHDHDQGVGADRPDA